MTSRELAEVVTLKEAYEKKPSSPERNPIEIPKNSPATVVSLSNNAFIGGLEKHISDYEAGEGHLSKSMYSKLSAKASDTSTLLASQNPDASLLYNSYQTIGTGYGNKARSISFLNSATRATLAISKAA